MIGHGCLRSAGAVERWGGRCGGVSREDALTSPPARLAVPQKTAVPLPRQRAHAMLNILRENTLRKRARAECAVQDASRRRDTIGREGCHGRRWLLPNIQSPRAPPKSPPFPPNHQRKQDARRRASQNSVRGAGRGKTGRVAGRRWGCHLPPSLTETRRAPQHLPHTRTHTLRDLGTALGEVFVRCHVTHCV